MKELMMARRYEEVMPKRQIDFIRCKANPKLSSVELTKMFNAKFGTSVSYAAMKVMRRRFAPRSRYSHEALGVALRERFQATVGTEKTQSDGYIMVKVAGIPGYRSWVYKHRLIWESHYGPCPKDHMICFLDNDKTNVSLDNLMAINRKMSKFLRTKKIPPLILKDPEAGKMIAIMHQLTHQNNEMARARKELKHRFQNLPPLYQPVNRPGFAY